MNTLFKATHGYVSSRWKVVTDGAKDVWAYDQLQGDCEDYVFAILWYYSDCSRWKFYRNVLFGPFKFWYVTVGKDVPANGHMVLEITKPGIFTEVLHRSLVPGEKYNFNFKYTFNKLRVVWKLIRGAMIRG